MTEAELDLQQVLREIDEEVRARRAAGDFPPGMERELDLVFSHFAPPATVGDDLHGINDALDRAAYIDPDPPVDSQMPAVKYLKLVERKLLGWFFRFLAQQVTAFNGLTVRAFEAVARRLDALEEAVPATNARLARMARSTTSPAAAEPVADAVVEHLRGVEGRVLVAEAGDGSLLRRLEGVDAYGVEPDAELAEDTAATGLDVREGLPLEHLRGVQDGSLGGAVLVGMVDRAPLPAKVALVERLAAALGAGGRLALVATDPGGWGVGNPVEADLAPGRPLHPATWVHVLTAHGFEDCQVVDALGAFVVTCRRA